MLSFSMSAYERPAALRVALSSLMAQTSPDWECFVMDEGDNAHIIESMNDQRIRRIPVERKVVAVGCKGSIGYLPKHLGASLAGGSHIAFSSEDIYYLPQFVEKMSGHDEDIIGCDMFINYHWGFHCLRFAPILGYADCACFVIKPEVYSRHPFTDFIPEFVGTADGRCVQACVNDGATWKHVQRFLSMHGDERP